MQKSKKSRKEIIEKLRMILDNPDIKDSSIKEEKHLNALQKRLVKPSKEIFTYDDKNTIEKEDSLKVKVTIHRRDESNLPIPESKYLESDKQREEEQKENIFEDEDLYEIEKVEIDVPEFIEVKPDEIEETEDEIPTWETANNLEDEEIQDIELDTEELPEWEPVEQEYVEKNEELKVEKTETVDKIPEWEPISDKEGGENPQITEEYEEEKEKYKKQIIDHNNKLNVFTDIKTINSKTAILLYDNGFTSIEDLSAATLKDLTEIKGIKKRLAKKIKKEIGKKSTKISPTEKEQNLVKNKVEKNVLDYKETQNKENGYKYGEYALYKKEVNLGSDKIRTIHYFSKYKPNDGTQVQLPYGYEVMVNKKTGVPYIRRKK